MPLTYPATAARPSSRKKARFHQLLGSAEWGRRVLAQWDKLPLAVRQELHYVADYRALIGLLNQVQTVVNAFSRLVKSRGISGYTQGAWQQLRQSLETGWQQKGQPVSESLAFFLGGLDAYLSESLASVGSQEPVLCCSDVVESLFGKYKYRADKQVITDESVKIAAFGRSIAPEDVAAAMSRVKHRYLREQQARQPPSLTKRRREALPKVAT